MTRLDVPELEDFDWFPNYLRDALTDMLLVAADAFGIFRGVLPVMHRVIEETGSTRIVDLCSGGGGPLLALVDALDRQYGLCVPVILTDKFPNQSAYSKAETARPGQVTVRRVSTDATAVPEELTGFRTLFNALHHFPPAEARAIFADAVRKRQPIASFEVVERTVSAALMIMLLPSVVFALTPLAKPRALRRFILTYGIPLVPAVVTWDGLASCMRAYSPPELEALVDGLGDDGYHFRVEQHRVSYLPLHVTALVGMPR